jgi:hypothetical protein
LSPPRTRLRTAVRRGDHREELSIATESVTEEIPSRVTQRRRPFKPSSPAQARLPKRPRVPVSPAPPLALDTPLPLRAPRPIDKPAQWSPLGSSSHSVSPPRTRARARAAFSTAAFSTTSSPASPAPSAASSASDYRTAEVVPDLPLRGAPRASARRGAAPATAGSADGRRRPRAGAVSETSPTASAADEHAQPPSPGRSERGCAELSFSDDSLCFSPPRTAAVLRPRRPAAPALGAAGRGSCTGAPGKGE